MLGGKDRTFKNSWTVLRGVMTGHWLELFQLCVRIANNTSLSGFRHRCSQPWKPTRGKNRSVLNGPPRAVPLPMCHQGLGPEGVPPLSSGARRARGYLHPICPQGAWARGTPPPICPRVANKSLVSGGWGLDPPPPLFYSTKVSWKKNCPK